LSEEESDLLGLLGLVARVKQDDYEDRNWNPKLFERIETAADFKASQ
jgi:hypothetical protein